MSLRPGIRLDAYEIVRPLGSGGMGEVWLATEVRLGRKVALKVLPPDLTRDPLRVQRFEQEARAASALNHPNVCTILALGETAEGQHYIAMEYVEGETLRQRLSASRLTIRESLDIAIQVAAALSTAHAAGIVHRDIKPENVMLRRDGFVKVLDFGLAKLAPSPEEIAADESTRTVLLTRTGVIVGTAAYMSPEQARGQGVDGRADIWSVGAVVYEMVAGRRPFPGPSGTDILAAVLDREPLPLTQFEPDTPGELQRILTKCLRKDRAHRYQVIDDLRLDLQVLRDESQTYRSDAGGTPRLAATAEQPKPGSGSRGGRRRRKLVITVSFSISLAVLFAAVSLLPVVTLRYSSNPEPSSSQPSVATQPPSPTLPAPHVAFRASMTSLETAISRGAADAYARAAQAELLVRVRSRPRNEEARFVKLLQEFSRETLIVVRRPSKSDPSASIPKDAVFLAARKVDLGEFRFGDRAFLLLVPGSEAGHVTHDGRLLFDQNHIATPFVVGGGDGLLAQARNVQFRTLDGTQGVSVRGKELVLAGEPTTFAVVTTPEP